MWMELLQLAGGEEQKDSRRALDLDEVEKSQSFPVDVGLPGEVRGAGRPCGPRPGIRSLRVCLNWPRHAMYRSGGHGGLVIGLA